MNRQRAHWIVGTLMLIVFPLTGAYMRHIHEPPVAELADATRGVFRSRHIFLLWIAVLNLALAAGSRTGVLSTIVSAIALAAPVFLLAAFWFEPAAGLAGGTFAAPALYAVFAAGLILIWLGRPKR